MLPSHNTGRFSWMEELGFTEDFFFVNSLCGLKYYDFIFLFFFLIQKEIFLYLLGKRHAKIVKTVRILISSTYQDKDIDFEYRNAVHF